MIDILEKILDQRRQRNWSEYRLCEKADLPQSTVSSWYRNDILPSITSLDKICKGFGMTLSQFFADEGSMMELTDDLKEVVLAFEAAYPWQKPDRPEAA